MDNKILSAIATKRAQGPSDSGNAPNSHKRSYVGPSKLSPPTLPPLPARRSGAERSRDKSPKKATPSSDITASPSPQEKSDYLTIYEKEYPQVVGPKVVKELEGMSLTELGNAIQKIAFQVATAASCYKFKAARQEKRRQAEIRDLKKRARVY